jgi:hypothetical protein
MTTSRGSSSLVQEEDFLPGKRLLSILGGVVVVSVALGLLAVGAERTGRHAFRPSDRFSERSLGRPQTVSGLQQDVYGVPPAAPRLYERQRRLLESYGWADRAHGIVRIPIERAIQLESVGGAAP